MRPSAQCSRRASGAAPASPPCWRRRHRPSTAGAAAAPRRTAARPGRAGRRRESHGGAPWRSRRHCRPGPRRVVRAHSGRRCRASTRSSAAAALSRRSAPSSERPVSAAIVGRLGGTPGQKLEQVDTHAGGEDLRIDEAGGEIEERLGLPCARRSASAESARPSAGTRARATLRLRKSWMRSIQCDSHRRPTPCCSASGRLRRRAGSGSVGQEAAGLRPDLRLERQRAGAVGDRIRPLPR